MYEPDGAIVHAEFELRSVFIFSAAMDFLDSRRSISDVQAVLNSVASCAEVSRRAVPVP
jgi:hypothetical protein